jgi:hypothetical protein
MNSGHSSARRTLFVPALTLADELLGTDVDGEDEEPARARAHADANAKARGAGLDGRAPRRRGARADGDPGG